VIPALAPFFKVKNFIIFIVETRQQRRLALSPFLVLPARLLLTTLVHDKWMNMEVQANFFQQPSS
jgi:hypothetical protein